MSIINDKYDRQVKLSYVTRRLDIRPYLIEEGDVKRLDRLISEILNNYSQDKEAAIGFRAKLNDSGNDPEMSSVEGLLAYAEENKMLFNHINLEWYKGARYSVTLDFKEEGKCTVSAIGKIEAIEFHIDTIVEEIYKTQQDYGWWVKNLILNKIFRKTIRNIIVILFTLICSSSFVYLLGTKYGVNIDSEVQRSIPEGMGYYRMVSEAIKSEDTNVKLNALLYGELGGFTSWDQWILQWKYYMKILLSSTFVLGIAFWIVNMMSRLYPESMIVLGRGSALLDDMKKKRDIWRTGVILAFVVNLMTSIFIMIFVG